MRFTCSLFKPGEPERFRTCLSQRPLQRSIPYYHPNKNKIELWHKESAKMLRITNNICVFIHSYTLNRLKVPN